MELVWSSKLDEKYDCQVTRTGDRTGTLTVVDSETNETLLESAVGLSYGAQFGPDVGDVAAWQHACCQVIDGLLK